MLIYSIVRTFILDECIKVFFSQCYNKFKKYSKVEVAYLERCYELYRIQCKLKNEEPASFESYLQFYESLCIRVFGGEADTQANSVVFNEDKLKAIIDNHKF